MNNTIGGVFDSAGSHTQTTSTRSARGRQASVNAIVSALPASDITHTSAAIVA